ncbi:MAG: helix-turn-helix domain-containing protein [Bacilli bacterium]
MANNKKEGPINLLITDALCRLINSNKKYNDITIEDIIKEAHICRKSFYRTFKTKDEILEVKFKDICSKIDNYFATNCSHTFSGLVYSIFTVAKDNKDYILCFYKANQTLYFGNIVQTLINSKIFKEEKQNDPTNYYFYISKVWMVVGILSSWLNHDCDVAIEDIVRMIKSYQIVRQ